VSAAWKLRDILLGPEDDPTPAVYTALRDALVCRWLGRGLPSVPGVDAGRLTDAMVHVEPRVLPASEPLSA
jgi:hypothetical protein